jgi:hypothetical protein
MITDVKSQKPQLYFRSNRYYYWLIAAIGFMVFICIPLFIMDPTEAKRVFNNGMTMTIVCAIVIFFVMFANILGGVFWLLTRFKIGKTAAVGIIFLFNWVALSGFLFPVTTADGMLWLTDGPTNFTNLFLVFGLAGILTFFWLSLRSNMLLISMSVFILVAVLPTIPSFFSEFESNRDYTDIRLSDQKNVIVISFDGLPNHIIKDVLMDNLDLANNFKDFIVFDNASSSSPTTHGSVRGIMQGNHDFSHWTEKRSVDWRELYFNNNDKYDLYTNSAYNKYNLKGSEIAAAQYGNAFQVQQIFELYRSVAVRIATKHGVRALKSIETLVFENSPWKFSPSIDHFDDIVEVLSPGNDRASVIFMHFEFTHFPIRIDEYCVDHTQSMAWLKTRQNQDGLTNASVCAMKKYAELVDKLKALDSYDSSLIVFMSDHGTLPVYYDSEPHNLTINDHQLLGFDRYQPFLMVKDIGASNESIQFSQRLVLLDDLALTTSLAVDDGPACESTPGVDILNPDATLPENFFIHVVRDGASSSQIGTHKAVRLSRKIPLIEAMHQTDEIILAAPNPKLKAKKKSSD